MTLRDRLVRYLGHHPVWMSSGELQRIVATETDYTPRTAVRRLQELAESGEIVREIRRGHTWYKISTTSPLEENKKALAFFETYQPTT